MTRGPLTLECYRCRAPIGIPCAPDGTCCAHRITRALFVAAGVVEDGTGRDDNAGKPGTEAS